MFPLLPALLLLILQGPSSIERMALDGRLPAALEAVTRQLESQEQRTGALDKADAAVLASLLAFNGDPELSHALIRLLSLDQSLDAVRTYPVGLEDTEQGSRETIETSPAWVIQERPADCQRSRDGPI